MESDDNPPNSLPDGQSRPEEPGHIPASDAMPSLGAHPVFPVHPPSPNATWKPPNDIKSMEGQIPGGVPPPPFANWMMEGCYPFPVVIPNGQIQPQKSEESNADKPPEQLRPGQMMPMTPQGSTEDNRVAMNYVVPPMYPYVPKMDQVAVMQALGQWNSQDLKAPPVSRQSMEIVEQMKTIPTNVQVREMCQLKAWQKRLQKAKARLKAEADPLGTKLQEQQVGSEDATSVGVDEAQATVPLDLEQEKGVPFQHATRDTTRPTAKESPRSGQGLLDTEKPLFYDMEMTWLANRFANVGPLDDNGMAQMNIYHQDGENDKEIDDIKRALQVFASKDSKCYPFQLINAANILSGDKRCVDTELALYAQESSTIDDENEDDDAKVGESESFKESTPPVNSETKVSSPAATPERKSDALLQPLVANESAKDIDSPEPLVDEEAVPELKETEEFEEETSDPEKRQEATSEADAKQDEFDEFDDLEDELLDGLDLETDDMQPLDGDFKAEKLKGGLGSSRASSEFDLDEEFDFEVAETGQLVSEAVVPVATQGQVTLDVPTDDNDMFGEVEGTFSFDVATSIKLLDRGDLFYEWRKFRETAGPNLTIADFLEFENTRKILREQHLAELRPPQNVEYIEGDDDITLCRLYSIANSNMQLLLQYDHPDVKAFVQSLIYDLNAPNVLYSSFLTDEEFTTKDGIDVHHLDSDLGDATATTKSNYLDDGIKSDDESTDLKTDESLFHGKESDIRRNWRRRLQTLGKEARLALVNMGKSLKDIENASCSVEQSKAYDAVVEFCEVAASFKNKDYINLLNQSFDDFYEKSDPHNVGKDTGSNRRELIHTRVALNLTGILPLVGTSAKVQYARFHRPDFRTGLFDAHLRSIRGIYNGEWSIWPTKPLLESVVGSNFYNDDVGIGANENGAGGNVTNANTASAGVGISTTNRDTCQIHPSSYFIHSQDLTLGDTCKIALMEYIEQTPLVLSNIGMTSRIDNWVNAGSESDDSNILSLGPMGTICPTTDGVELFGIKHTLEPGQGQALLVNNLFKAPIFIHPRPGPGGGGPTSILNGATDFLMIRSKNRDEVVVRLRPLQWSSGVALYTVGQCEPKVEVPTPNSKAYMEEIKNLLKAWVLKSVMTGMVYDVKHLRKEARKSFSPTLPEKEVAHVLKQIESTPIFSSRAQTLERMIHTTIKPETICCLESARVGRSRLKAIGICQLKNPDNVGVIFAKMHQEEKQYQKRLQEAEKRLRELKDSYAKRLEAHGISGERLEHELSTKFNIKTQCSIYGHLEPRNLSPQIRFIEEVLKLTPWNITRDVKQVLANRGTAQFALHGFGDPSGGRGEAINLLKRQFRDENVDVIATALTAAPAEDLRKLSMEELGKRLKKYGVAESVIKTLPRWDQVALVRQYRDDFGGDTHAEGNNRWRIPPEEYQRKLNDILIRQRDALAPDDPTFSDDDEVDGVANAGAGIMDGTGVGHIKDGVAAAVADADLDLLSGALGSDSIGAAVVADIADALLEGFEDKPDKDIDSEMRDLEILRQMRETTDAGPMTEEEKLAQVNRFCAVPGFMWLRQSRKSPTEPFGNERAVFVYGEENIKKMLQWRRQRALLKRDVLPTLFSQVAGTAMSTPAAGAPGTGTTGTTGKRLCRACGQTGHIASNPKCPLYRGDKVRDASFYTARAAAGRRPSRFSDSSDGEVAASTNALERDTHDWLRQNLDALIARQKRRYTKFKMHVDESDSDSLDDSSAVAPSSNRRKRTLAHDGFSGSAGASTSATTLDAYEGAGGIAKRSKHHDTIMKSVARVLRILEKDPRFKPFVHRIPESVAPNYYKIIKRPMWIQLLKSKVKNRYYNTIVEFLDDMGLLEINCKTFNPPTSPNAWLRQQSELLVDELVQRLAQALVQLIPSTVFEDWITMHKANHRIQLSAAPSGEFV